MCFSLPTLFFRTDAGGVIGTGHFMRCFALAQAWQQSGGKSEWLMAYWPSAVEALLHEQGMALRKIKAVAGSREDSQEVVEELAGSQAVVVVDGYHFGEVFQKELRQKAVSFLVVEDDEAISNPYASWVLNQNAYAKEGVEGEEAKSRFLLGSEYVLLRKEFWKWVGWKRSFPEIACKILVTMGGADPQNQTARVMEALRLVSTPLEIIVLVGMANRYREELKELAKEFPHVITLRTATTEMPELLAQADLAIGAGGSTAWELAYLGLPNVMLQLADNQKKVGEFVHEQGIAVFLGDEVSWSPKDMAQEVEALLPDQCRRQQMSQQGQQLIDGRGVWRVLSAITGLPFFLRVAEEKDSRQLWEWANDPMVRLQSFHSSLISWKEHEVWWEKQRAHPDTFFYVAEKVEGLPVGSVRFEKRGSNGFVISLSLDAQWRGRGWASLLIEVALQVFWQQRRGETVHAWIKPSNEPSLRAFERAGFQQESRNKVEGEDACHFVKVCPCI